MVFLFSKLINLFVDIISRCKDWMSFARKQGQILSSLEELDVRYWMLDIRFKREMYYLSLKKDQYFGEKYHAGVQSSQSKAK